VLVLPFAVDFAIAGRRLRQNLSVDQGLVNGARGEVIGFDEANRCYPIVRFSSGNEFTVEPAKFTTVVGEKELAVKKKKKFARTSLDFAMLTGRPSRAGRSR
jgi:hypothetical protein